MRRRPANAAAFASRRSAPVLPMSCLPVAALCLLAAPPGGNAEVPADYFLGTLSVFGSELRLLVELPAGGERAGDFPQGALLSPDQSPDPVPLTAGSADGATLMWSCEAIGASFTGAAAPDAPAVYEGLFTQGLLPLPLTMRRVTKAEADAVRTPPRPQTPVPPLPYRTENVTFPGGADGATLAGTLTRPDPGEFGPGPYAAAVLVSGSGPQDRDETLFGHKPFAVLADALTRAGVAVLRYDDRGTAESTGDFAAATTADFAADALAAVRFLAGREDVRTVGVIGHSEGGLIAPLLASEYPDEIGFVVLLAGPAVPGRAVLESQGDAVVAAGGGDAAVRAFNLAGQAALFAAADSGDPPAALAAALPGLLAALPEADRDAAGRALEGQLPQVTAPWMRAFLALDPAPALRKTRCPALACFGGRDVQVTVDANLLPMTAALADNPAAAVVVFPGLNHLFQPATTGLPAEYGRAETTLDPAALELIVNWVARATAG